MIYISSILFEEWDIGGVDNQIIQIVDDECDKSCANGDRSYLPTKTKIENIDMYKDLVPMRLHILWE